MRSSLVMFALFARLRAVIRRAAQASVAGEWSLSFNTPGGTRDAAMSVNGRWRHAQRLNVVG